MSAELYGIRHRGSFTVVSVVWLLQIVLFAYLANYIVSLTVAELPADQIQAMKDGLAPSAVAAAVVGSLPMYGGPVMIILGALIGAGDERSGMLRTVLSRFPERGRLVAAKLVALTALILVLMAVTFVVAFLCGLAVSLIEGTQWSFPSLADTAAGLGAAWLIGVAWAVLGFGIAVLTRSLAGTIAIGLLWALVLEQALHGLAGVATVLESVRPALLSGASAILAESVGSAGAMPAGTPDAGVPVAIVVLSVWIAVSAVASAIVFRRRDVA
ncbi:ABC transporter permease subunit [Stackebrandtia albiflava]|uniref:ABC transporter permease subunit n=1 Tax=Stackebrandtia albiflava TaxID=406432 RepID=UPI0013152F36|nr:ABC transporter permease subunit [Stackebrandtia albiflava]